MLQHTLDRAARLSPSGNSVTVIARSHLSTALPQLSLRPAGKLILQPLNRDTAAGIFLAATHVRACNPEATVAIFPSDHFVCPEDRFVEVVRTAVRCAEELDRLVLLGVAPHRAEPEYGWIRQGALLDWTDGHPLREVNAFLEKPGLTEAQAAMGSGALWNTLVFAARIKTLWAMGWTHLPELMSLFERYAQALGTSKEQAILESIYREMPPRNFSVHLLERASRRVAVMELSGVLWSDWGTSRRILETLLQIGKTPAFPPHLGGGCSLKGQRLGDAERRFDESEPHDRTLI